MCFYGNVNTWRWRGDWAPHRNNPVLPPADPVKVGAAVLPFHVSFVGSNLPSVHSKDVAELGWKPGSLIPETKLPMTLQCLPVVEILKGQWTEIQKRGPLVTSNICLAFSFVRSFFLPKRCTDSPLWEMLCGGCEGESPVRLSAQEVSWEWREETWSISKEL